MGFSYFILLVQRRKRDSNPRNLSVQRFSRPPQSTTLPSLHVCKTGAKVVGLFEICKHFVLFLLGFFVLCFSMLDCQKYNKSYTKGVWLKIVKFWTSCKSDEYYNNPLFAIFLFRLKSWSILDWLFLRFKLPFLTIGRARCAVRFEKRPIWLPETGNTGKVIKLNSRRIEYLKIKRTASQISQGNSGAFLP